MLHNSDFATEKICGSFCFLNRGQETGFPVTEEAIAGTHNSPGQCNKQQKFHLKVCYVESAPSLPLSP